MSVTWSLIVGAILLLIIYSIVSSKAKTKRQREQREKSLPFVQDSFRTDIAYNIYLGDGRKFLDVKLIGTSDNSVGQFAIGGWEGMLVLMQVNGKRVFLRQSSVRCIEEA